MLDSKSSIAKVENKRTSGNNELAVEMMKKVGLDECNKCIELCERVCNQMKRDVTWRRE